MVGYGTPDVELSEIGHALAPILAVVPREQQPLLIDMAPTLVAALGAPTAVEPTGRVLQELLGADAHLVSREASSGGIPGMDANDSAVTDTEADEMEEHLRGLGYIE